MKLSVYIANRDVKELAAMEKAISNSREFKLIGSSNDGKQCYEEIKKIKQLDVLILDLIITTYDGYVVLEKIKTEKILIDTIICISSFASQPILDHLYNSNVDQFVLKPFEIESFVKNLKGFTKKKASLINETSYTTMEYIKGNKVVNNVVSLERRIFNILNNYKIPMNVKGYNYLQSAIKIAYFEKSFLGQLSKSVYPEIANIYHVNSASVERAMRHSIKLGISNMSPKMLADLEEKMGKPLKLTITAFISMIVMRLRLEDKEGLLNKA